MLACLALAACQGSEPSNEQPSPPSSPTLTATLAATPSLSATRQASGSATVISGDEAYDHVLALAEEVGPRPTGSDAERQAAQYIAQQLTSYGYQTETQEFTFEFYLAETATLEMVAPESLSLDPRALHLSAAGDVTAELVSAGIGRPEDFPPQGLGGGVALIERGELSFSEKVANAAAAGAAAVIISNNQPDIFRGDLEVESIIPAVALSQEQGRQLLSLLDQGTVTVHLFVEAGRQAEQSQNVVARAAEEDCQVAVGAHYDSLAEVPGANDNASGVAALLETARVLVAIGEQEGVCFLAFGAEEPGLFGSRHFVTSLGTEGRSSLKGMVNLDMVGVGEEWQLIGSPALVERIDQEAATLGLDTVPTEAPIAMTSDYVSFTSADVPAVFVHRSDDPRYHSESDRAEFVEPELLKEATELAILAVRELQSP